MTIKQQGGIFGRNPSFNDVASTSLTSGNIKVEGNTISSENTNGDILLSPNGSGDVSTLRNLGVGTSTPFSSSGKNIEVSDANVSRLIFNNTSTNGNQYAWYSGTSGQAVLYNYTDSVEAIYVNSAADVKVTTGNLVIGTSGKGIDFSATAGTGTSELFDDYEEGTFSPYFFDDTNGTWAGSTASSGYYVKVGKVVHLVGEVTWSAKPASGATLRVRALPFTSANPSNPSAPNSDLSNSLGDNIQIRVAGTDFLFYAGGSLQGNALIVTMASSGTFKFNVTYFV